MSSEGLKYIIEQLEESKYQLQIATAGKTIEVKQKHIDLAKKGIFDSIEEAKAQVVE